MPDISVPLISASSADGGRSSVKRTAVRSSASRLPHSNPMTRR